MFSPGDIVKVGEILLKLLVEENNTVIPKSELVEDEISMNYAQELQDSPMDENAEGGVLCTLYTFGKAPCEAACCWWENWMPAPEHA